MPILNESLLTQIRNNDPLLETLDLNYESLDLESVKNLAAALKVNNTVRKLRLANCIPSLEAVKFILEALEYNKTLKELDLAHNFLANEGAKAIGNLLTKNNTLQVLNLEGGHFKEGDAEPIAEALKYNSTLRVLLFDRDNLGAKDAKAIAEALKHNTALRKLQINRCPLGLTSAKAMAEMLKCNDTLQELSLYYSLENKENKKDIIAALKHNNSLRTLALDFTIYFATVSIPQDVEVILKDVLESNYTLAYFSDSCASEIRECLERNEIIFEYLAPVREFEQGVLKDPNEIKHCKKKLSKHEPRLISKKNPLPETNYLRENYRLLTSLSHLADNDLNAALLLLAEPFQNSRLQAIADKAFNQALFATSAFDEADESIKKARYQWLAYHHRNNTDALELKVALTGLEQPNQAISLKFTDPRCQEDGSCLLSYQALWNIAKDAYTKLELKDSEEAFLLNASLEKTTYQHGTLECWFMLPSFLTALQNFYPENKQFRCLEAKLFFPNYNKLHQILNYPDNSFMYAKNSSGNYKNARAKLKEDTSLENVECKLCEIKEELCQFIHGLESSHIACYCTIL